MSDEEKVRKGLVGVIADESRVSSVMQASNTLTYRGYSVGDLCDNTSFEEVAYLLLHGELPTRLELEKFSSAERENRNIDPGLWKAMQSFPMDSHPMDALRSFISLYAMYDTDAHLSQLDKASYIKKTIKLLATVPMFIAWDRRRRVGLPFVQPKQSFGISENFYNMCFAEVPKQETMKAFDVSLILYAEHSFNASTFTARVVTSTLSDYYSAITAAVGALKGPLHGGANEAVMQMFDEIGSPEKSEAWTMDALLQKKKIMGFGHRVYKNGDSRVATMQKYFFKLAELKGDTRYRSFYENVAKVMLREKNIHPNLDYPSAPVYRLIGFETFFFTPIFVMSRIAGWSAHILEQAEDNRLIRPICKYSGAKERSVPRMDAR